MAVTSVPTRNPLITAPFVDADESSYAEVPVEKQFELRVANATPGTGTLVEQRNSTTQIVEAERVGETLELLTSGTGLTPTAGVTLSAVATNPTGYSGTSLQGAAAAVTGAVYVAARTFSAIPFAYSGGATLKIWTRISNLTNVTAVRLRIGSGGSPDTNYYEYNITPTVINTFEEKTVVKGTPSATLGTFDPANVTKWGITLVVTASYTGNVLVRDLRVGTTQTNKTTPDGHLAWESSYDFRIRYRDAASPTTVFGPWSAWATIKASQPPVVTATAPANGGAITDPTPTFTFTYSSGKAKTGGTLHLYEVVGGEDELVGDYDIPGTAVSVTLPALVLRTGKSYAWIADAVDTDGLVGSTARWTFTTNFSQPAVPTGLVVTTDEDSSSATLAWTGPLGSLYEWRVYRRTTGGQMVRISANGATWEEGDAPIILPALTDYHVPEGIAVEYLLTGHSGSASGEGESEGLSATGALVTDRWMNVIAGLSDSEHTFEVRYVRPGSFTETPDLPMNEQEVIDRPTLHVSKEALREPTLEFELFIVREDRDLIRKLRSISNDDAIEYAILKSPEGDVWRVQYGTIPKTYNEAGTRSINVRAVVVAQ